SLGVAAARLHRRLLGRSSRWEGALVLLVCMSPLMIRSMRTLNVTLPTAALLALSVGGILASVDRSTWVGLAGGGIIKATTAPLAAVLAALGVWRPLAVVAALAAVSLAGTWVVS